MCPFRITWCIAPGAAPRGSLERGSGKACDHRCVAMIGALRETATIDTEQSRIGIYFHVAAVIQVTWGFRPRRAAGPARVLFLISPNGPWCPLPGRAELREEVGLTEHTGRRVDDQGQGERGVLAHEFHGDRRGAVAGPVRAQPGRAGPDRGHPQAPG